MSSPSVLRELSCLQWLILVDQSGSPVKRSIHVKDGLPAGRENHSYCTQLGTLREGANRRPQPLIKNIVYIL